MAFVRSENPIWAFVDNTGIPLNDNYYVFFLSNDLPYIPVPVYQDPQGITPWADPLQLSPAGTLPDNLYFDTVDALGNQQVYRIEIRRGNSQSDPLAWPPIENYIPEGGSGPTPPSDVVLSTENQISNPQFSQINFVTPLTLTSVTNPTVDIAAGWQIIGVGTGNLIVSQVELTGDENIDTNPPFALRIETSGSWTSVVLQQTFSGNGALWANQAVSTSITAVGFSGTTSLISVQLITNTSELTLLSNNVNSAYTTFTGSQEVLASINTADPDAAFTAYVINLPVAGQVGITSVQLLGQDVAVTLPYQQETPQREIDHLFNVYYPQLAYKPIPSYLVGWDFPLNPGQATTRASVASGGANTSRYIADQTILFQSAASGVTVTADLNASLVLQAAATGQFAIIQYLGAGQAREVINNALSVMVSASSSISTTATISLWYTTSSTLPDLMSGNSLVATLDANGKPATFNGTWVEIPRSNFGDATFTIGTAPATIFNNYGFNGWDLDDGTTANMANFFAIVVGTQSVTSPNFVAFDSVSLVPGEVPTIPAPLSNSLVLNQCQLYFETSYQVGTAIGTATAAGSLLIPQACTPTSPVTFLNRAFGLEFLQAKRVDTTQVAIYSPVATTLNNVFATVLNGAVTLTSGTVAISNWTATNANSKGIQYIPNSVTNSPSSIAVPNAPEAFIQLHYYADARLGIV